MPLWHEDYFELKAIKKKQTQEKPFALPPICLKAGHKFTKVSFLPSARKDKGYSLAKTLDSSHWRRA